MIYASYEGKQLECRFKYQRKVLLAHNLQLRAFAVDWCH